MASGGDYYVNRKRFQDTSMTRDFVATDGNLTLITGRTSYTQNIQRIIVTFSTSAAQTVTFQDTNGTPLYVCKIPASPGADTRWDFDFGPDGKALTSGQSLQMAMTAGNAGHVEVQAYQKLDNATAVANT